MFGLTSIVARAAAPGLAALAVHLPSQADGGPRDRVPLLPAYVQECGSCHVAYPPSLLPAASWRRLMANLGRHYGSDASLDAAATRTLDGWLVNNAGSGKRAAEAPPEDRITLGRWFRREHREVESGPAKASDCAACHTRAAEGRYGEREIRLPKRG